MKSLSICLIAALMLFLCASTVQAQNKSAEKSKVISEHAWLDIWGLVNCPSTGEIFFDVMFHQLYKVLPNGTEVYHFNVSGESRDGLWKWHDVFNLTAGGTYQRTVTIQGPKGEKLSARVLVVVDGKGDVVHTDWDHLCL